MQAAYAYEREQAGYGIFRDKEKLENLYGFLSRNNGLTFYQCVEILSLRPTATRVMTYDEWHEITDRRISRGSKGIPVLDALYPSRKKYFFDVSQTYGFKNYNPGENITDAQLIDAIKNQCIWTHGINGTYRNRLYSAITDYCDGHYILPPDKDSRFFQAVTDSVFSCVVNRYNKPQDYIHPNEYAELDGDEAIAAASAVKNGFVSENPVNKIKLQKRERKTTTATNEEYKAIPPEARQKFLDALEKNKFLKALCTTLMFGGLRIGEVLALRWRDINLDKKTIYIDNAITQDVQFDRDGKVLSRNTVISDTKTAASVRGIPIPNILVEALRQRHTERWRMRNVSESKGNPISFVNSQSKFHSGTRHGS